MDEKKIGQEQASAPEGQLTEAAAEQTPAAVEAVQPPAPEATEVAAAVETAETPEAAVTEAVAAETVTPATAATGAEPAPVAAAVVPEAAPAAAVGAQTPPPSTPASGPAPYAQAPVPGAPMPASAPSATPALVCGILAIVLSFIPIVGIVLGIVAIVLAGNYFKSGGTQGSGKAGRICGIIGIVLSAILIIVNAFTVFMTLQELNAQSTSSRYSYTSSSASASSSSEPSDTMLTREAINDVAAARLDEIKDADPEMMAYLETIAIDSFEEAFASNGLGMTMANCGVDPAEYIALMAADFDYTMIDIDADGDEHGDTADGDYYLTMRDITDVIDIFNDDLTEKNATDAFAGLSDDEVRALWGQMFMSAVEQASISDSNYLELEFTNVDGQWVIDEDQWKDEMEYFFGLV